MRLEGEKFSTLKAHGVGPALPLLGIEPKEMKTGCRRHVCTLMFAADCSQQTRYRDNRVSNHGWMRTEDVVPACQEILTSFSHEEEANPAIGVNVDGP